MKKFVEIREDENEGFMALMGKTITVFCMNYIYTGKLIGVNDTCILLEGAKIVYETGPLNTKDWKDAQALPNLWYISTNSVESFGELK